MNLQLENGEYAVLFALLPMLLLLFAAHIFWRKRSLRKLGNPLLVSKLIPGSGVRSYGRFGLLFSAVALTVSALLNPRFPQTVAPPAVPTADVVFVVDVSVSMLATDAPPNRLAKTRQILAQSLATLDKCRAGIVVYAAQAYPFVPLTDDLAVAASFVPAIQPGLIWQQGTKVGKAIETATFYFSSQTRGNRVVFILSDGENHDAGFEEEVRKAAAKGISVHTIGIGTEAGSNIELESGKIKTDAAGQPVRTRLEAGNLRRMAETGRGQYWPGVSTDETVRFIAQRVEAAALSVGAPPEVTGYRYLFQWLVGAALACLLFEMLLLACKKSAISTQNANVKS